MAEVTAASDDLQDTHVPHFLIKLAAGLANTPDHTHPHTHQDLKMWRPEQTPQSSCSQCIFMLYMKHKNLSNKGPETSAQL